MAKPIMFSTKFPAYHIHKGLPTFFVEKFLKSIITGLEQQSFNYIKHSDTFEPKYTTIRAGHRWKAGDYFSPRVWGNDINEKSKRSGPYHSKQITIGPDTLVKQVYNFTINKWGSIHIDGTHRGYYGDICKNDGLTPEDFRSWFKMKDNDSMDNVVFDGQIICWVGTDKVKY